MSEATDTPPPGTVPRHARIDVVGGVLVMFVACLIWYGAIGLEVGQLTRLGSGALPKALALVLLAGGAGLLANGLLRCDSEAERVELVLRPSAVIVAAMLIFGLFIRGGNFGLISTPQLGLTVVGPLTVFIAGCATPSVRFGELLVTAFGLTAGLLLIFADLLGVSVPVFPEFLEAAISGTITLDAATRVAYCIYGMLTAALYFMIFGWRGRHG